MKGTATKALLLVLIFASVAYGQMSFDFCGGGARAEGMGKAFLGVSDDVTGGSWNPAGIYTIDKPIVGLSWGSLRPRGASNMLVFSNFRHFEHSGSFDNIGSLNFAAPIRIKGHPFVGSFNYTRNFDVFENYAYFFAGDVYVDDLRSTVYLEEATETRLDGGVNSVSLGFGTRLYENISFGLSANVYTGKTVFEQTSFTIIPDAPLDDGMQVALREHVVTVTDTNKFSGVNFTIGFKYSGEKLGAGLVIKTPFELAQDFDESVFSIVYINGLPFDDGTDTLYFMDRLTKYEMPWMVGLGLAYNVKENFLLAADVEARAFKGRKVKFRESIIINPGGDNEEIYVEIDPQWNNAFVFRFGGEYLLQTGIGEIPLRAGAGACPIPTPNYGELGETSTATSYGFSLGTGIHWEQIRFDVAYSLSTIERQFWPTLDYTNRNHHLNFSFTGVF
ncbi:MAG: hypothetical protein JSW34_02945 [Candidatus Zixiibacteriota bacterium]|nr:MAG: hypothetical protein JSW34_02945 [candidate division Zixibacteria bacterium]